MASRVGRSTSADPARPAAALPDPRQWNQYAYARNSPLRFVDPDAREVAADKTRQLRSMQPFEKLWSNFSAWIALRLIRTRELALLSDPVMEVLAG